MDEATLRSIRSNLEEERSSVERQLAEYGVLVDADRVELPVDEGGFADSAQATAERSELLSIVEGLQKQRAEIVAALGRIDEGTYGKCERCGREIAPERLEARPAARLCVECQRAG